MNHFYFQVSRLLESAANAHHQSKGQHTRQSFLHSNFKIDSSLAQDFKKILQTKNDDVVKPALPPRNPVISHKSAESRDEMCQDDKKKPVLKSSLEVAKFIKQMNDTEDCQEVFPRENVQTLVTNQQTMSVKMDSRGESSCDLRKIADVDLTEESVHQVAGDEKDFNMTALVTTHLQNRAIIYDGECSAAR